MYVIVFFDHDTKEEKRISNFNHLLISESPFIDDGDGGYVKTAWAGVFTAKTSGPFIDFDHALSWAEKKYKLSEMSKADAFSQHPSIAAYRIKKFL